MENAATRPMTDQFLSDARPGARVQLVAIEPAVAERYLLLLPDVLVWFSCGEVFRIERRPDRSHRDRQVST